MSAKLLRFNFIILFSYILVWLMLDLISIYTNETLREWARLAFNILPTMPILSAIITFRVYSASAGESLSKSIAVSFLTGVVMFFIGAITLAFCATLVHLWIGGSV